MSTSMDECRSGCGCGSPLDEDTGRCVECGADSRQVYRTIDEYRAAHDICITCGGRGFVWADTLSLVIIDNTLPSIPPRDKVARCPSCDGSGRTTSLADILDAMRRPPQEEHTDD